MKNLPLILVGGGVLLLLLGSKKSQAPTNSKFGNSLGIKTNQSPKGSSKENPDSEVDICTGKYQYIDNGKCVTFWDDSTEKLVLDAINIERKKYKEDELCFGSKKIPDLIIKTVMIKLWPEMKDYPFPPSETDKTYPAPGWLVKIYRIIGDLYYKQVCGFDNTKI